MSKRINWKKMRLNVPNKIKFNSKVSYEVFWSEDFHFDGKNGEKGKTYGITRFDPKQVVINTSQPDKEAIYTIFHELMHLLSFEVGANLTEAQVTAMEKTFPAMREFILKLEGIE